MTTKKERGDFQTPPALARQVVEMLDARFDPPDRVIEPTCGVGALIVAAAARWGGRCRYEGYEINPDYVARAREALAGAGAEIRQDNFFDADWAGRLRPSMASASGCWETRPG